MAEPKPETVETLAGCITDGPISDEHRAMARAQLLALAPAPRQHPRPSRAAALRVLRATERALEPPAQALAALGAAVGPAFGARLAAITGQPEAVQLHLATLLLDL